MIKLLAILLFILGISFSISPTDIDLYTEKYDKCIEIKDNKVFNPFFLQYSLKPKSKKCHHVIYIGVKKHNEFYISWYDFNKKRGLRDNFSYNETLLKNTIKAIPFLVYYDKEMDKNLFWKMRYKEHHTLLPFYINNTSITDLFLFQYTDNLKECKSKFCFIPSSKHHVYTFREFSGGNIIYLYNDTFVIFNHPRCVTIFKQFLFSGDPLIIALWKTYLKDKSCSAKGKGNYFSYFISLYKPGWNIECNKDLCFYRNVITGEKSLKVDVKDVNPVVVYSNGSYFFIRDIKEIYKHDPSIIYTYKGIWVYSLNDTLTLTYYSPETLDEEKKDFVFLNSLVDYFDGVYYGKFLRTPSGELIIIEEIISPKKKEKCTPYDKFSKVLCNNRTLPLKEVLRKWKYFNNTLYLYFKDGFIVGDVNSPIIPFKLKKNLTINCTKKLKAVSLSNNTLFFKVEYTCGSDKLTEELLNFNKRREKELNTTIYIKRDKDRVIYLFPKEIEGFVYINNNRSINLSKYYKVEITKEIRKNLKNDSIVFLTPFFILLSVFVIRRKFLSRV